MTVLRAFIRGAVGGFVVGFVLMWLAPVFDGKQSAGFQIIWTAFLDIHWMGVFIIAAIGACIWAWSAFWYETELGQELRFWDWVFKLWR